MSTTPHQITITGLVLQEEGEPQPDCWPVEAIIKELVPQSINVSSAPLTPHRTEKRVYSCSICGERHPSNRCPAADQGGAE